MNISRFFVDKPIFAAVLSVIVFVAGLISIFQLPISEYPEVVPPSVVVRAQYPGANPKVIAETVATPIEQEINGVEDMLYMTSQNTSDGALQLTVTFKIGTNVEQAETAVQNRVQRALPRLPEEVRQIGVTTVKSSPNITMVVHLNSPDGRYDDLYLRNYATLNVKDQLARITGMGDVQLFGSGDYAMRVWLDPQKVAARGLTASDVVNAIREQNVQVAAGVVGQGPSKGADFQLTVNTQGRLQSEEEFGNIVVKTSQDGATTLLKDVARLEMGSNSYALRSLLNNKSAVAIPIFQSPTANALQLSTDVRNKMAELSKDFPQGMEYSIVYDPTQFVRESIDSVVHTLIEAVVLVALVVIVFLQTWRASVIPLLAVPVSVVGTFAVMLGFGFSINTLSLFGLVLAIGIVVDDAIVVVENVERNIENGLTPHDATVQAMKEVSGPIIAIALVLCAVFVPIAFVSGLTGQFYRQFALTIAISTVISAFLSLTLAPALSAVLLQPHGAKKDALTRGMDAVFGRFFKGFNRFFHRSSHAYESGVQGVLKRKSASLACTCCSRLPASSCSRPCRRASCRAGQGLPDRLRPAAGRRFAGPHRRRHPQDVGRGQADPGRGILDCFPWPVDQRLHQCAERRHRVHQPEALRRAQGQGPERRSHRRRDQQAHGRHRGRLRDGAAAAAGERPRHHGRLQDDDRRPRQPRLR
jgi:multidrug efflux pump